MWLRTYFIVPKLLLLQNNKVKRGTFKKKTKMTLRKRNKVDFSRQNWREISERN